MLVVRQSNFKAALPRAQVMVIALPSIREGLDPPKEPFDPKDAHALGAQALVEARFDKMLRTTHTNATLCFSQTGLGAIALKYGRLLTAHVVVIFIVNQMDRLKPTSNHHVDLSRRQLIVLGDAHRISNAYNTYTTTNFHVS